MWSVLVERGGRGKGDGVWRGGLNWVLDTITVAVFIFSINVDFTFLTQHSYLGDQGLKLTVANSKFAT